MVAAIRDVTMTDVSRQKRFQTRIGEDGLAPTHTVGQAVEFYLGRMGIRDHGLRWTAISRGVKLDSKQQLGTVPAEDTQWTVMPEVSAG